MSCQILTMLFLASLAQEKKEWRPIFVPPAGSRIVHVGVRVAGNVETRQITVSMPAPADEDEAPVARRDIRINIIMGIVDAGELRPMAVRRRAIRGGSAAAFG